MNYKGILMVGKMKVEVTASNERELFERASFLAELPSTCQNCESDEMIPNYRSPQGNDYYAMVCRCCGWRYKIGITKETKQLFPKREWEPPFRDGDSDDRRPTGPVRTQTAPTPRPITPPEEPGNTRLTAEELDRRRNEQYTNGERSYPPSGGHGKPYGKR
jgi:hypothetical protein